MASTVGKWEAPGAVEKALRPAPSGLCCPGEWNLVQVLWFGFSSFGFIFFYKMDPMGSLDSIDLMDITWSPFCHKMEHRSTGWHDGLV